MADSTILRGAGLTKRYGGVVALDGVDFEVAEGQILGLVGPNGAGKTTLVDLITGAQAADGGSVAMHGREVTGSAARRGRFGLARTFQHPMLAPELSIIENLVAGTSARRLASPWRMAAELVRGAVRGPADDYATAASLAAELGVERIERLCADLTLGEQRLVEVARALAQNPVVMLLDEPFAGADPSGVAGTIEAVRAVQARGHAVVLVDHNVDLIASLADAVLLLDRGQVAFTGTPDACLASAEMQRVYFGGGGNE